MASLVGFDLADLLFRLMLALDAAKCAAMPLLGAMVAVDPGYLAWTMQRTMVSEPAETTERLSRLRSPVSEL